MHTHTHTHAHIYIYIYIYEVHTIGFQTFFVWALLLTVHTWISIALRSNLLRLLSKAPWKTFGVSVSVTFVTASFITSIVSKRQPLGITEHHREQGRDYREREELSWCPSSSNSLWQGWSCWLVHCPAGNATNPIWRVLASFDGISSWTPLKH